MWPGALPSTQRPLRWVGREAGNELPSSSAGRVSSLEAEPNTAKLGLPAGAGSGLGRLGVHPPPCLGIGRRQERAGSRVLAPRGTKSPENHGDLQGPGWLPEKEVLSLGSWWPGEPLPTPLRTLSPLSPHPPGRIPATLGYGQVSGSPSPSPAFPSPSGLRAAPGLQEESTWYQAGHWPGDGLEGLAIGGTHPGMSQAGPGVGRREGVTACWEKARPTF